MRKFELTTLIAAGLLWSGAAFAAMDDATKAALASCQAASTPAAKGIEDCSKVLAAAKLGAKSAMQLHYDRGGFYLAAGNDEKASEDFSVAIKAYEEAPDKADWPVDFIGVVASSYAFRGKIEADMKKCDAAKNDFKQAAATTREVSERKDYESKASAVCK